MLGCDVPRIWVTRSAPFGEETAAKLRAKGYEVFAAPLLMITPVDWAPLPEDKDHLIFTSRHGVEALAAKTSRRHWPCICVGDATARAAREAGFAKVTSASGTAKDVIDWVQDHWPLTASMTHISGGFPRGNIIETLQASGYKAARRSIYYKSVPVITDPRPSPQSDDYVLLYSPRGAAALAALGLDMARMTLISLSVAVDLGLGDKNCKARYIADKPNEPSLFAHLPHVM